VIKGNKFIQDSLKKKKKKNGKKERIIVRKAKLKGIKEKKL